jgi:hypothetical protein
LGEGDSKPIRPGETHGVPEGRYIGIIILNVSPFEGANLSFFVTKWWESFEDKPVGVSEIYKLVMESEIQIDLGNGKSERCQKTSLGKILSSLRDRQIGGYRVVNAGNKNGAKLWKLIGQEVTAEVVNEHHEHREDVQSHVHSSKLLEGHDKMNINEHTEHFGGEEKNNQDVYSNISDIIQYDCDLSNKNENVIAKYVQDVQDVQDVHFDVKEQHLILPEHPDVQSRCSVDVHCESLSQSDEISSQSSITETYELILTDPFFPLQNTVPEDDLTPFICRGGCKHYDGIKDARDGIFKEFCCYERSCLIKGSRSCYYFEGKNPVYDDDDGILRF